MRRRGVDAARLGFGIGKPETPRRRGGEQLGEGASRADQSALLRSLLGALMEQREHLIAGDVQALHRANARLSELLEAQTALGDRTWRTDPGLEPAELAELLSLADRVTTENAINHMLATRGLQFADLSFQMLEACTEAAHGPETAGQHGAEECPDRKTVPGLKPRNTRAGYSLRLLDTRR